MKTKYQILKQAARDKAVEWQQDFANHNYSCEELTEYQGYFGKLGKRYGLLAEFRENGII